MRYGGDGYFWINDMTPRMVAHPMKPKLEGTDLRATADPNGKHLFVAFVDVVKAHGAGFVDYVWDKPGAGKPVPKLSYVAGFAPWQWVVGTGIYIDDVDAAVHAETITVAWQTALILLVISLLAFAVSRSISRPVGEMADRMRTLAAGEVGDDASAAPGLVETRAAEAASCTEDGVATVARARAAFEEIAGAVEEMSVRVAEIATAVEQIGSDAQRAEADVAEVASVAEESSASAEQVSASTQQTSASTQEIAASAQTLARTAERLDQLVHRFKVTA